MDHNKKSGKEWGYNWNSVKGCNDHYDYKVTLQAKVPSYLNLIVSAVNDGDVTIQKVDGNVRADNVNGSISLMDVNQATYVCTINGDVKLDFNINPTQDARYYSLNGDIKANYKEELSAEISFKSFNGDFYTNISKIEYLPAKVEVEDARKGKGISYKLNGKSMIRAGKGGAYLDFETFNGNVYVKEIN